MNRLKEFKILGEVVEVKGSPNMALEALLKKIPTKAILGTAVFAPACVSIFFDVVKDQTTTQTTFPL